MTNKDRLEALLLKSSSEELSDAEREELWILLADPNIEIDRDPILKSLWESNASATLTHSDSGKKMLSRILKPVQSRQHTWFTLSWGISLTSAAAIVLVFLAIFFFPRKETHVNTPPVVAQIEPGSNRAILTLADGTQVSLDQMGDSILAGGNVIKKTSDGRLIYTQADALDKETTIPQYHTISTPKGGVYQVMLPDGTSVHLNSGSSLKYPTVFSSESREVEIAGEAYFEVAKHTEGGRRIPFIVHTGTQQIEVLGTQFNINAYPGKKYIKTTLVEGSVKVHSKSTNGGSGEQSLKIKPGYQVINDFEGLRVQKADISQVIAWKGGYFVFNNTNIKDIMEQMALWYNIDVSYRGDMKEKNFGGIFKRSKSIYQILENIEQTGSIRIEVEGREVTIIAD